MSVENSISVGSRSKCTTLQKEVIVASIPKKVITRLTQEIGTFQKVLATARDRDINESDTVAIVSDILASAFGFDKYTEVTSEFAIRNTYCDLAIKVDDKVQYLIEVKAIGLSLKENHLRQALNYGANQGIPWVVLTNGIIWEIYRIRFEKPIDADLVCTIDLLSINPRKTEEQEKLFLLCKEGLSKAAMDEFHERVQSVNRFIIGALALSEPVISTVRRELKKMVPGLKVDNEEIERILKSEVLKREVIEGDPAAKAKTRVKRATHQAKKRSTSVAETSG
jgi:predicted type IV restriction endonuclease